jgi:hypothetical protein
MIRRTEARPLLRSRNKKNGRSKWKIFYIVASPIMPWVHSFSSGPIIRWCKLPSRIRVILTCSSLCLWFGDYCIVPPAAGSFRMSWQKKKIPVSSTSQKKIFVTIKSIQFNMLVDYTPLYAHNLRLFTGARYRQLEKLDARGGFPMNQNQITTLKAHPHWQ